MKSNQKMKNKPLSRQRGLFRVNSQIYGAALQFTVKSMEQSSKLQSKTINEETLL
jgi:hypothetical protein